MSKSTIRRLCAAVAASVVLACAASDITGVDGVRNFANSAAKTSPVGSKVKQPKPKPRRGQTAMASLLVCPTSSTTSASALVTPLAGGVISAGGISVAVPAGAVLSATTITLTVPASQYMEIDVSAAGVDHFLFELPVTVTMSYARCSRSNIDRSALTAWYIDRDSKALLEEMPSIDDKLLRTVTFTTGHLSGYALAN